MFPSYSGNKAKSKQTGFTLVELLVVLVILSLLISIAISAVNKFYAQSSTAVSAHTLRQLNAAAALYLGDNENQFWQYRQFISGEGVQWWFGFESLASMTSGEGNRQLEKGRGPLGPYLADAAGGLTDPSFALAGRTFKPKYGNAHFAFGYNALLSGRNVLTLKQPGQVVVFSTCAQVNTFQSPASSSNPMLEEFYLIDDTNVTVHFRHGKKAMVGFANGQVDFIEMEESTRDDRMPEANIGRFAPVGSLKYLE